MADYEPVALSELFNAGPEALGAGQPPPVGDRLNLMLPWVPPEGGLASFFAQVVRPLVEAYRK